MRRSIGPAYFMVGGFYVALAAAGTLPAAALCVLLAHFGGSILWVFSTVLLQMEVPDEYRGRLQGVFTTVVAGGPRMGDVEAGAVAAILDHSGVLRSSMEMPTAVAFSAFGRCALSTVRSRRPET